MQFFGGGGGGGGSLTKCLHQQDMLTRGLSESFVFSFRLIQENITSYLPVKVNIAVEGSRPK